MLQLIKLIGRLHDWVLKKKWHLREAESLRSKDGQKFSKLQKTMSPNCGAVAE